MRQALEPTTTLVEPTRNRDEFAAKYKMRLVYRALNDNLYSHG